MTSASTLRISLGPSRLAAALIFSGCLATALLLAWLPGEPILRAVWVTGIGAHAVLTVRKWATRSAPHAIVGVELCSDHTVCLIERGGRRVDGRILPESYVGGWLTTLVALPEGKRTARTVAILPDMLPADDYRRLRLLMRHGEATPARP
jgi:hypothetical protein